ncbi:hypothetical protein M9H77_36268 [Catharanthus roseus]|uniref:Uncharacterized protein n=1 Tax=Catharanthus roseus TaxID=4058 RepID=A0ACB9ZS56_CATRO|nr:hypothetical protein M9H77_36268 [Catharanthus roseus]
MSALRQFTWSTGKSASRNSLGCITIFHRGGRSKRLQRRINLKRSTLSMGTVERIEYDPNCSSRIALKYNTIKEFTLMHKIRESTTTTIWGPFLFSSLPEKVDQRKVACFSPRLKAAYVMVGLPTRMLSWSKSPLRAGNKKTCMKDTLGLVGASEYNESKPKMDEGSLLAKPDRIVVFVDTPLIEPESLSLAKLIKIDLLE